MSSEHLPGFSWETPWNPPQGMGRLGHLFTTPCPPLLEGCLWAVNSLTFPSWVCAKLSKLLWHWSKPSDREAKRCNSLGGWVSGWETIVCSRTIHLSYSELRWVQMVWMGQQQGLHTLLITGLELKGLGHVLLPLNYEILVKSMPPQLWFPIQKNKYFLPIQFWAVVVGIKLKQSQI